MFSIRRFSKVTVVSWYHRRLATRAQIRAMAAASASRGALLFSACEMGLLLELVKIIVFSISIVCGQEYQYRPGNGSRGWPVV